MPKNCKVCVRYKVLTMCQDGQPKPLSGGFLLISWQFIWDLNVLPVTPLIAAALTIIFIKLSFNVISLRRKHKLGLGNGGHDDLERAIRAQGNFAKYVPIGIILIVCLVLNRAPWWLVLIPGIFLIIGRLIHARGINTPPPDFSLRLLRMKFIFSTLIALVASN